jgi:hypothetical protein
MKRIQPIIWFAMAILTACSQPKTLHHSSDTFVPPDDALFQAILVQDSLLFQAFNSRNLEGMMAFFTPDLKLYQDNDGVKDYVKTKAGFESLFNRDYILERKPVAGSMEVYPIKDFGAIQTGKHTFCHTENGKLECGTFKFMHIWRLENQKWQIVEVITYGH